MARSVFDNVWETKEAIDKLNEEIRETQKAYIDGMLTLPLSFEDFMNRHSDFRFDEIQIHLLRAYKAYLSLYLKRNSDSD